ncbi:MAG TPA: O-antigen ligase family protein [bacterium]|nr:O-antigen ligase family protein [bacterium]
MSFQNRVRKICGLSFTLAVFFTPLLFFTGSRDQFELPKLVFLALLAVPWIIRDWSDNKTPAWTPLSWALFLLATAQSLASLPSTSLSWTTSLLGDYENFSGLTTLFLYLTWFSTLHRGLSECLIEKGLYFNSLAALFSSLYAIGQHFGFDFIQWNPESINATREFASLGNPNFLSAYLAMSLPLYLYLAAKPNARAEAAPRPGFLASFMGAVGVALLLLTTPKGMAHLQLSPLGGWEYVPRGLGLLFLSAGLLRFILFPNGPTALVGFSVLLFGLLTTGSRGGFLGALAGGLVWVFLALRRKEWSEPFRQKFSAIPKVILLPSFVLLGFLAALLGHSFLERLWDSLIHAGRSLAVSRLHIWKPGLEIVKAHPLLGIGLDNFKIAFPYYSGVEFNQIDGMFVSSRMAHNELLQMASTTGLLGFAAYVGVIVAFGLLWWRTYRSATPPTRWILIPVLASAVAFHVQNLFSFGVAAINLLWFFDLAIVQYFYLKSVVPPPYDLPSLRIFSLLRKTSVGFMGVILFLFPVTRLGADIAYNRGISVSDYLKKYMGQKAPSELLAYSDYEIGQITKAAALCPLEVKYDLYLGLAYEQRAQMDPAQTREFCLKAAQCYEKAVRMSPANAYYYNDLGRVYATLSGFDTQYLEKAERSYGKAVQWAPASPYFIINWAMALRKIGKNPEAEQQMERSFNIDPAFAAKVLSQMAFEEYQKGDKTAAFGHLAEAIQGNPSSAESYYARGILYLSEKNKKKALADFEEVKKLNPTPEKNPSIQSLDQLIAQAKN